MIPFSRLQHRLGLCALAMIGLSSCQHFLNLPTPMPSGYTYHNDLYKSPPSPEADNIGYTYSTAENDKIMAIWQEKAREVLQAFTETSGMSLTAVFISPPPLDSAQNYSFDHALRDELRAQKVTLAASPFDVLTLSYEISRVPDENAPPFYPRAERIENHPATAPYENYEPMVIELSVTDGPQLLANSKHVHIIPMFGYRRDYGNGLKFHDTINGGYTPHKTLD